MKIKYLLVKYEDLTEEERIDYDRCCIEANEKIPDVPKETPFLVSREQYEYYLKLFGELK